MLLSLLPTADWLYQLALVLGLFFGGLVNSTVTVTALTAQGTLSDTVAGIGAVLASPTSGAVHLPLVARIGRERL